MQKRKKWIESKGRKIEMGKRDGKVQTKRRK